MSRPRSNSKKRRIPHSDAEQLELSERSYHARADAVDEPFADEAENAQPRRLRDRAWNAIIGLSLVPFAWILTDALFQTFRSVAQLGARVPFWMTHEFLMFAVGGGVWLVWFCITLIIWREPRPLRLYIWGHELMHVLMARLFGGRISEFQVTREGGYITTDRYNFLIALAPYLWPFYSVPVLAVWSVSIWMHESWHYREWFLGLLGFTWMFHLSFTLWMLPKGQTDFHGPGKLFSLVLIYLANVFLLGAALVVLAPEVSWSRYLHELWASGLQFYECVIRAIQHIATAS